MEHKNEAERCFCGCELSAHEGESGPCADCRKVFADKICADGRRLYVHLDGCASYRPAPLGWLRD